jgi:hypothetical protein
MGQVFQDSEFRKVAGFSHQIQPAPIPLRFKASKSTKANLEVLKAAIRAQLTKMIEQNSTRGPNIALRIAMSLGGKLK